MSFFFSRTLCTAVPVSLIIIPPCSSGNKVVFEPAQSDTVFIRRHMSHLYEGKETRQSKQASSPPVSMYVCMYGHHMSPCVPENLVSRDGFSRPVPRQPAHVHTQAESGAYLRDSSRVPRRRPYETAIRHRVSPEFIGSRNCVPMAFTAESPPAQGQ